MSRGEQVDGVFRRARCKHPLRGAVVEDDGPSVRWIGERSQPLVEREAGAVGRDESKLGHLVEACSVPKERAHSLRWEAPGIGTGRLEELQTGGRPGELRPEVVVA